MHRSKRTNGGDSYKEVCLGGHKWDVVITDQVGIGYREMVVSVLRCCGDFVKEIAQPTEAKAFKRFDVAT